MDAHWHQSRHSYPVVDLPAEAELIVIGGGLAGCSLALTLAEAGLRPLLIERSTLGEGASGRNGGLLLPGSSELFGALRRRWGDAQAIRLWGLATAGAEMLRARIEALEAAGLDCGWQAEGGLHVATSEAEATELREDSSRLAAAGFDARWLEPTDLAGWCDLSLPAEIRGALLLARGGSLHSGRLVTALAAAAVDAGARIAEGVEVSRITASDPLLLESSAGEIRTGSVFIATNAWAGRLLPHLAEAITPVRGQVLSTRPLPPRRIRGGWSLNRGYEYLQQRPDGRLVLGGMRWTVPDLELGQDEARPRPAIQARLDAWLESSWPALLAQAGMPADVASCVERRWAGIMAWTPDRLPLIGPAPDMPGVWMACGFSGHGVPFAPLAAEILLADQQGRALPNGSEAFDPRRYSFDAPPVHSPASQPGP